MEFHAVRLYLELPGELVVMEVPRVASERRFKALDAAQLPFPPSYDSSGNGIHPPSARYEYKERPATSTTYYEPTQHPFPPPYDHGK